MSSCTRNKWGPGIQSTNKNDSSANKEMEEKLKKLQQERDKQDTMWSTTNNTTSNNTTSNNTTSNNTTSNNTITNNNTKTGK